MAKKNKITPQEVDGELYVEMIKEFYRNDDSVEAEFIYIFNYYLTQEQQEFLARQMLAFTQD